jgi:phosphocarrier protein
LHFSVISLKLQDRHLCLAIRRTAKVVRWLKKGYVLVEREIQVTNKLGLHARPAFAVVQTTSKFKSEIWLIKEGVEANAKSILSIMALAAEVGSRLIIKAEGEDEEQAAEVLAKLFADKFGEE